MSWNPDFHSNDNDKEHIGGLDWFPTTCRLLTRLSGTHDGDSTDASLEVNAMELPAYNNKKQDNKDWASS